MCLIGYIYYMKYKLESTQQYDKWFSKLKDHVSKIRILAKLSVDAGIINLFIPH